MKVKFFKGKHFFRALENSYLKMMTLIIVPNKLLSHKKKSAFIYCESEEIMVPKCCKTLTFEVLISQSQIYVESKVKFN